jgi:NADPH:quinone reductase-like Zn-dependent oxidoreductase
MTRSVSDHLRSRVGDATDSIGNGDFATAKDRSGTALRYTRRRSKESCPSSDGQFAQVCGSLRGLFADRGGQARRLVPDVAPEAIGDWVAAGCYTAKPANMFRFDEIRVAHRLMESGQANGKIVARV